LSPLELLQTINVEFGLPATSTSKKTLIDQLNHHLLEQRGADRRAVVVVDEAQALSVEVLEHLRLLSNLETTTEKLLRIILVGQPQLRTLLAHPELAQLNQRITLRWHIGPLARDETVAYVRHRLQVASDGHVRDVFSAPALRAIHRRAHGVPRLINMLCHRAMLAAFAAEQRTVGLTSVRQAYREVATLPLPAPQARRRWMPWAGAGVAGVVAAVAIGATLVPWLRAVAPHAALTAPEAVVAEAAPELADAPAPEESDGMSIEPVAAIVPEPPPPANDPPPAPQASPPDPTPDVQARLAAMLPEASARAALDAVLRAWQMPPLAPDESSASDAFQRLADRRGLEHLAITGNTAMLRLLDVPAVLELRLPGTSGPRYVALVGMRDRVPLLAVGDGTPVAVQPVFLEKAWYGQAHVFSRDFEGLGPGTLDGRSRGARVTRLQGLLKHIGAYGGPESGLFDPATSAAVLDFQRSRYVSADGIVGPLTRVALYAAAGGYPRPTLSGAAGGPS
jgi:general secretion pathway protein A